MRVIRTEMFFERRAFKWMTFDYAPTSDAAQEELQHQDYQPNISIAWLQHEYDEPHGPEWAPVSLHEVDGFIKRALKGFDNPSMRRARVGDSLLAAVLSADIVIERSPPTAIAFKELIAGAGKATTGTALGYAVAHGHSPEWMILTVPGGVILMGTAVGVSKGLQEGLATLIKAALSPKRLLK